MNDEHDPIHGDHQNPLADSPEPKHPNYNPWPAEEAWEIEQGARAKREREASVNSATDPAVDSARDMEQRPRRRRWLPLVLFLLTCLSTFWVGITEWQPTEPMANMAMDPYLLGARKQLIENWTTGLVYMVCIMSILLLHELGHFFTTLFYRVPATPPIFLPFPFNPIGTLGAVIGMQGTSANRRQIFDIGIAGPLAGLVLAIPIAWIGVTHLDFSIPPRGGIGFRLPLLMQWMMQWAEVPGYDPREAIVWLSQLNPYFAAAWVGLLITGLNMMPVGQLDGGHITYTLFRQRSFWIAEASIVAAIAFMVYRQHYVLIVMVGLILIMGPHHPPTSDDSVPLGKGRWMLGLASLSIPFLCFPPLIFKILV